MTTAISKEGIKRRLLFTQSVLMVHRSDSITFYVEDQKAKLGFNVVFTFSDEGQQYQSQFTVSPDGKTVNIVMYKWMGTNVENSQPLIWFTSTQARIWIKWRTTANTGNDFRSLDISVWIEEN